MKSNERLAEHLAKFITLINSGVLGRGRIGSGARGFKSTGGLFQQAQLWVFILFFFFKYTHVCYTLFTFC